MWAAIEKLRAKNADATFDAVRELAGDKMADATIRTQRQRFNEFHGITRDTTKPARKSKPAAAKAAPVVSRTEESQTPTQ